MSVYHRYASGEYDDEYFEKKMNKKQEKRVGHIQISPLVGLFSTGDNLHKFHEKNIEEWLEIFPNAAYFKGYDETLFGEIIVMIYESLQTGKLCTTSFSKFGVTSYDNLILDARSRFWPSCENLLPEFQKSNVRRSLAITNLKNYNKIVNNPGNFEINRSWDETHAGNLANNMTLISEKSPVEFGLKLLELGFLQTHYIQSTVLDVIYDNSSPGTNERIVEENNKLVFLIGTQLEQLFDPLLEYSPEIMEFSYNAPVDLKQPQLKNNALIDTITSELITVQTNFTMGLVNLLQNFIIPLRVHVLSATSSSGITKINQVFPPTIDEITRINCILHDSLSKASKFGYFEVIKAMGTIIPYFYKAFIRHEANLKNFRENLSRFYNKYDKKIFKNDMINKGKFGIRDIDSIVSGSLLELPKLKLILVRLNEAIMSEKIKERNFEDDIDGEFSTIEKNFKSAINVIDAFGFEDQSGRNEANIDIGQRVFTPTGKILTELASNWPPELQYGWLARKVVGIYEMRNIKPFRDKFYDLEVMIIFSDHILFLTIVDDAYYLTREKDSFKNLSVSDVLMHSLVNDKPLPKLELLPSMEVNCWCDINEVLVTTYRNKSTLITPNQEFLKFINITKGGFKSNNNESCITSKNYEILEGRQGEDADGCKIIELINKSTILNKRKPFHLFRSNDPQLRIYSIAQELWAYKEEACKSSMALYLNLPFENPKKYFEENKSVNLVLYASFINYHQIHVVGFNRAENFELDEIILSEDLQTCLKDVITKNFGLLFNTFSNISKLLTQGYGDDLTYCTQVFTQFDKVELNKKREERIKSRIKFSNANRNNRKISEAISIPEVYMTKISGTKNIDVKPSDSSQEFTLPNNANDVKIRNENKSKRKSVIKKVFRSLKKSFDGIDNGFKLTTTDRINLQKSSTLSGKKNEYASLYKPQPYLKAADYRNNINEPSRMSNYSGTKECTEYSETLQQSRNTSGSLDINSHFEFPPQQEKLLETIDNTIIMVDDCQGLHKKTLTEDEILVLGDTNPSERKDRTNYEKFNIEDFYMDGEANWVKVANEKSSVLNSEIRALKEEANMDTEDVIEIRTLENLSDDEIQDVYSSEVVDIVHTTKNLPATHFNDSTSFSLNKREISTNSLAPSEIAEEFEKQIDFDFGSTMNLYNSMKFCSKIKPGNNSRTSLITSSDEEFFSSDEFAINLSQRDVVRVREKDVSPTTFNSSSSDTTIINGNLDDKLLPNIPIDNNSKYSIPSQFDGNMHDISVRSGSFSTTYESMTYLSEILKI